MTVRDLTVTPLPVLLDAFREAAECRFDPDLHTGPDAFTTETPMERMARVAAAKDVCDTCPVWEACLEFALRVRPKHGVYAGYTPYELRALIAESRTTTAPTSLGEVA
jgi:WhiB family transcriptional regulator, redox-sensing transcriptional regulator